MEPKFQFMSVLVYWFQLSDEPLFYGLPVHTHVLISTSFVFCVYKEYIQYGGSRTQLLGNQNGGNMLLILMTILSSF